ncbi:hypothetical protein [Actinomycetospora sp. NBRC 106375]|uniref:hypothetical protein n=1 Tax=Actinomycetospora sp. NBRC 106375 TaxID=3032207 RepID=UPI0025557FC5|nr:hypothetical protein [Actinomycetospora sp. NBRC 106375]
MGRHRHLTCVRSDGLSAVLTPLLDDRRIVAATLVDVDSGLVLDGYVDDPGEHPTLADVELLGAAHADMVRAAAVVAGPQLAELTVSTDDGHHHLLHAVPDPHGERLVVAVVVHGSPRHVTRARLRLRTVSVEALTAGPTLARRPVDGSWVVDDPAPVAPAEDPGDEPAVEEPAPLGGAAPLSAMAPRGAPEPTTATTALSGTVSSVASPLVPGLAAELSSPLVPLSDGRPATARTGPAGR